MTYHMLWGIIEPSKGNGMSSERTSTTLFIRSAAKNAAPFSIQLLPKKEKAGFPRLFPFFDILDFFAIFRLFSVCENFEITEGREKREREETDESQSPHEKAARHILPFGICASCREGKSDTLYIVGHNLENIGTVFR